MLFSWHKHFSTATHGLLDLHSIEKWTCFLLIFQGKYFGKFFGICVEWLEKIYTPPQSNNFQMLVLSCRFDNWRLLQIPNDYKINMLQQEIFFILKYMTAYLRLYLEFKGAVFNLQIDWFKWVFFWK